MDKEELQSLADISSSPREYQAPKLAQAIRALIDEVEALKDRVDQLEAAQDSE